MRKRVTAAALIAALPAVANAAFLVTYPSTQTVPVANPANNFAANLAAVGITRFASTNATLALTTGGLVKFEFFGKEALLRGKFDVTGISFTAPSSPVVVNNFAAPVNLGTVSLTPATFNPKFSSMGVPGVFTPGSSFFGIGVANGLPGSNGSFTTNSVWMLFDDNAVPDDNHDDLIIRATYAVPEPSTWAMMILGFGVIGFAMRRRSNYRVSFV
jgi:hypothetical protein